MGRSGIYTLTCLVNNKMYVGQTTDLDQRKSAHFSELRHHKHKILDLQIDYDKYGEENFVYEKLLKCKKRFLYSEEHYWCNLLQVHNPLYGYNIQPTNPYGKGKSLRSTIDKTILHKYVPVIMLDSMGKFIKRFDSCKDAAKEINVSCSDPGSVAIGNRSHCKGFVFVYEREYDPTKDYSIMVKRHKRNVLMYDKDMNLLQEFKNTEDAVRYIDGTQPSLWRTLNGLRDTYKGYIWKFGDKSNEVSVYKYYKSKLLLNE